jgi:predicted nucleotidyltransferase
MVLDEMVMDTVHRAMTVGNKLILFLTVGGSRVYDTAIDDSDHDLLGAFSLPLDRFIGIDTPSPKALTLTGSIERMDDYKAEYHLHEIGKFCSLVARCNPSALESVFCPVIKGYTFNVDDIKKLKNLSKPFITTLLNAPYKGIFKKFSGEFAKGKEFNVKKILNVYRSLIIGMHVIENGFFEFSVPKLSIKYGFEETFEMLMTGKREGNSSIDLPFLKKKLGYMYDMLNEVTGSSPLPPLPRKEDKARLNEFVVSFRKKLLLTKP